MSEPMKGSLSVAEWIRASREATGLSQAELGERGGVSQGLISHWETCRGRPKNEDVAATPGPVVRMIICIAKPQGAMRFYDPAPVVGAPADPWQ